MSTQLEEEKVNQTLMDHIILGVAHELNNPNAFIRMNATNLKKMIGLLVPCLEEYEQNHPGQKIGPYLPSEFRAKMVGLNEAILGGTVRIISIADKLKQSSSFAMTQNSNLSLVSVIKNVIQMHQFLIDKWAKLDFKYDENESYEFLGHQLQLEQALSILLTNACDAISERFNKSEQVQGILKIQLTSDQNQISISFIDNGCGIDAEIIEKIWTPYFTTKPQGVGDGLGMPLCRAVIERHGGSMAVKSQKNVGTEFTITLPKNRED